MNTPSIAALEAILFAAPRPFTLKELAVHLDCTVPEAHKLLQELEQRLAADPNRGLMVDRVAHGYRLATKPELGEYVARVSEVIRTSSLSQAALETLAIVAYRGPVTRAEIEAIRGVRSDSAINALLERGLIEECGRKEAPGRPVLFQTTSDFLLHFGLNDLSELPPLPDKPEPPAHLPFAEPL
ncbi:MAG: SMC-Scp complex subunit ScpB [Firmicutes bacterium]|nr:SMC-Scp complex subunit ScpB [Bacillota bacterium]